jgi:hypothetical protein
MAMICTPDRLPSAANTEWRGGALHNRQPEYIYVFMFALYDCFLV